MKIDSPKIPMVPMHILPRNSSYAAAIGVLLTLSALSAFASQKTWSGAGADNNWGTAGNWAGLAAPVNGDSLIFAGTVRTTNVNNITGLNLTGIGFNNSLFLFGGNFITNSGGIYDSAGNNTNNLNMILNGSQAITNAASGTILQLGGAITNLGAGNVLTFGGAGTIYANGVITATNGGITMVGDGLGNGIVRLGGANTFSGGVTISSGTVQINNGSAIPNGGGKGDVTNNGTLDLNASSQTMNNLYGTGTIDNKSGTGTYTLTVGNSATNEGGTFEYDGAIQNSSGNVALTKVNTNQFYLNGSLYSYSGKTTVNAGILKLGASAAIPATAAITISPGAQLDVSQQSSLALGSVQTLTAGLATNGGSGDILGSVDNSGNIIILNGSAPGTLTITNSITFEGGSKTAFKLNSASTVPGAGSNDLITINGTLGLNGGNIQLNPYQGTFANGTYTLVTNQQALVTGSAVNLTTEAPRGITATFDSTTFPGNLLVNITGTSTPANLIWNGACSATWDEQTSQNWLNNGTPDYFYFLDNVTFNDAACGSVTLNSGVSPGSTTFNNIATNYTLSGSGSIAGPGPLIINSNGIVTLNTLNDYIGNTVVNFGQLLLGTYNGGTFVNNQVVYNGVTPASLVLGNGGTYLVDTANTFYGPTFSSLVVNPGGSSIAMRGRQSNSTTYYYQFNNPTVRNIGGTLDFSNPQSRGGSKVGVYFGTQPLVNGIIGGYATLNLNDWVVTNATAQGNIIAAYAGYQTQTSPSLWGATSNVNLAASTSANINTATINSLKISAGATATINTGNTLTLSSGGILIPSYATNSGVITGGTLEGAPSADLIVLQNSPTHPLTIASTIADNTGSTALTKSGLGTLILAGANSYSGVTYINGATILGNGNATPALNAAGTLQVGTGGASGDLGASTTVTNYGILAYDRSDNITLNIPVNGPGELAQSSSGVLTLAAANTYSGPTVINAGTLQVGTGGTTGTMASSSAITNNGKLVIDHSDAVTINQPIVGSGSLVNLGAGTLTLNNSDDTYSGVTTVSNGVVALGSAASIPNSSSIVIASGATLDDSAVSGGISLTGGIVAQTLAGSGTVNGSITAPTNTTITPATNGVVGTLAINSSLTMSGGNLNLDVGSSSGDLITVGGTLTLNAGNLVLNILNTLPNGTYKLIGYGSFSGDPANLSISGFSQPGHEAVLTNNTVGKEIDLLVFTHIAANLTWVGDGLNNFWDINTSADWTNGTSLTVFHNFDIVTFDDTSLNTTVNIDTNVQPGTVTINTAVNNYTFAGTGSLGDGGSIIINATNTTVTVTAPFQNTGPTTINTGTVQVGNGATQGSLGTGPVTNNGTINFNEPANTTWSAPLAGSGGLVQQGATTLTLLGNNTAYSGPITISGGVLDVGGDTSSGSLGSGPVTNNGTLLIDRTGTFTLNNNIAGAGPVAFVANGTITYGGNNTYANNTYISNGIVKLGASTAIPADGGGGDWLVLDGVASGSAGVLDLNGNNLSVNAISGLNGTVNGVIENNAGATATMLSIIGTATTTYNGVIKDNGGTGGTVGLFIGGAANQTLSVQNTFGNTYTGGTTISNATVTLSAASSILNPVALGTGTITLISNATLNAVGAPSQSTSPTWNSLNNTIIIPAGNTVSIHGPQRGTMLANITGGGTLNYYAAYVRGNINGNWRGFTGQIIFGNSANGGNLGFGNTNGFGRVFCTNSAGSLTLPSVLMYNTVAGTPTLPIGELADDGSSRIAGAAGSGGGGGAAANFAVGGLNTSTTYGGSIIDTGVGIIKVGTGTLTLTNSTLTYGGQTTVSNGVLALGASATLPSSTPITVAAGATLDVSAAGVLSLGASQTLQGNGTVNGSIGANGTVSPGGPNSIGSLTITNDANLTGTVLMELNRTNSPATNDLLVANTIEVSGTLQVNNLGPDLQPGDTFKLFSVPATGTFAVTNLPATSSTGAMYVWTNKVSIDGTIQVLNVVQPINFTPTNMTFNASGGTLTIIWPGDHLGWALQSNSVSLTATNQWYTIPGSTTVTDEVLNVDKTQTNVFFRMQITH